MSKVCRKCGRICENDSVYCAGCSAEFSKQKHFMTFAVGKVKGFFYFYRRFQFKDMSKALKPKKLKAVSKYKDTQNALKMLGSIFAFLIFIVILCSSVLSQSRQEAISHMFKGLEKANASEYYKAFYSETYGNDDVDVHNSLIESTKSALEQTYGSDFNIKYNIIYTQDLDKSQVKALKEKSALFSVDSNPLKISDAKIVEVEIKYSGSLNTGTVFEDFRVVKISGSWYVWNEDLY